MISCPVCPFHDIPDDADQCPSCHVDLTPLRRIRELPLTFIQEGLRYFKEGKLDLAIEKLIGAISLAPDSVPVEAHLALGDIYAQKGLYDEAIAHYDQASRLAPDNMDIKKTRAKAVKLRARFQKLLFIKPAIAVAAIAAVFIGLKLVCLPSSPPPQSPPDDSPDGGKTEIGKSIPEFPAVLDKLKSSVADHPDPANLNIEIAHDSQAMVISGTVPSNLHRSLITALAKSAAEDIATDIRILNMIIAIDFGTIKSVVAAFLNALHVIPDEKGRRYMHSAVAVTPSQSPL